MQTSHTTGCGLFRPSSGAKNCSKPLSLLVFPALLCCQVQQLSSARAQLCQLIGGLQHSSLGVRDAALRQLARMLRQQQKLGTGGVVGQLLTALSRSGQAAAGEDAL